MVKQALSEIFEAQLAWAGLFVKVLWFEEPKEREREEKK